MSELLLTRRRLLTVIGAGLVVPLKLDALYLPLPKRDSPWRTARRVFRA
jgi:hypothetical protein